MSDDDFWYNGHYFVRAPNTLHYFSETLRGVSVYKDWDEFGCVDWEAITHDLLDISGGVHGIGGTPAEAIQAAVESLNNLASEAAALAQSLVSAGPCLTRWEP